MAMGGIASAGRIADVGGVILAGGRGLRMGGVDKGWVTWRGRPLIEWAIERLAPQVADITIVANRNVERYRALGHAVVSDPVQRYGEFNGPLVGMLAGLQQCPRRWAAIVPCDAPLLPADVVHTLLAAGAGRPAVASVRGRLQPVICVLPVTAAAVLAAALDAGERRPGDFLRQLGAVEVAFADADAFRNINAPEDAT